MAGSDRGQIFSGVSLAMQIGHAVVAIGATAVAALFLLLMLKVPIEFGRFGKAVLPIIGTVPALHLLMMLPAPLWSWLAARSQTRGSHLWAWLGYLIPLASYWLPARTLSDHVDGSSADAENLRRLILAWGCARGLGAPSAVLAVFFFSFKLAPSTNTATAIIVVYLVCVILIANLLSLLVIGRVRAWLGKSAVDERHAEVFA